MQKAVDKLDDRVIDITTKTLVDALESYDAHRNKEFIKGALRSTLNELLVSILVDSSSIRKSIEDAIIQVATAPKLLVTITSTVAKDTPAMVPTARYIA